MKSQFKILMLTSIIVILFTCGCSGLQNPVKIILPPDLSENDQPQSAANPKRFESSTAENPNAIESALEISEKYAELAAKTAELKQENKYLQEENLRTQKELEKAQTEFDRAQLELNEANDLIMEMRVEMNNWKTDVLGFREEMRQADIAQLETLQKVLEILGGEVTNQVATADSSKAVDSSQIDPNTL